MTRWVTVTRDDRYLVSDEGEIKNAKTGHVLSQSPNVVSGHMRVMMGNRTTSVHVVVLESFVGPCPPGMETRHLDDDPSNNRLTNLCWGTRGENVRDRVRNGVHNNTRKTHCPRQHEFTEDNIIWSKNNCGGLSRRCRKCHNDQRRERRRLAKTL